MENPADIIYITLQVSLGISGKDRALTRIWKVYGKGVYYFISRYFPGDNDLCDDCFQETMLKLYSSLDNYSPGSPIRPWIYAITRNCCIDHKRRYETSSNDIEPESLQADYSGPEENYISRELSADINRSMGTLEPEDSRIAFLRFHEGMKYKDIAFALGMNENTVKTRMDSIKKKLRYELKEWL